MQDENFLDDESRKYQRRTWRLVLAGHVFALIFACAILWLSLAQLNRCL